MTRPSYDPMRAPAPRFPRHRFQAAGLPDDVINRLDEQYAGMGYEDRVHFAREVTRSPNEELARRFADGSDRGASPQMLSPKELADQMKQDQLRQAAHAAGVPAGGTKVDIAQRLIDAGATGDLPIVTPEQVAADAAPAPEPSTAAAPEPAAAEPTPEPAPDTQQTPAEPPSAPQEPQEAPAAPAPQEAAPSAPGAQPEAQTAPPTATDPLAPADPAAPAPQVAPPDGVQVAPETPAAPAAGTTDAPQEGTSTP